jgi:hypothetical protein
MIDNIAGQLAKSREMATRILTWVACSFRPLKIAEIHVALIPEFKNFVNLKHTVEEICGHCVVIKKSKIVLIHQMARQFLLEKTIDFPIKILGYEGHKHSANVCIHFLSRDTPKSRRIFSTIQT